MLAFCFVVALALLAATQGFSSFFLGPAEIRGAHHDKLPPADDVLKQMPGHMGKCHRGQPLRVAVSPALQPIECMGKVTLTMGLD